MPTRQRALEKPRGRRYASRVVPFQCASPLLFLLVAGASIDRIGVRLEDAQGLSEDDGRRLASSFARSIQDATGIVTVVDERIWEEECDKGSRCGPEIRARTGAKQVVFLKAYGAATRFRLIAERTDERTAVLRSVQADLLRDEHALKREMRGFVEILFPDEAKSATSSASSATVQLDLTKKEPPPSSTLRILAWSSIGAGAVAAGVATGFRLSSNSTRSKLENQAVPMDEIARDMSTVRTNATLSNFLFGGAAVLVTAGLILILDH